MTRARGRLGSYVRRHHVSLLALFVALGGSAYAAATINSASVVDNSLTGADVRGRQAGNGKPFTQGTLTGDDIKDASVTGADIFDNSLTGADVLEGSLGKVPNADRLDGFDSSAFLQTGQQAADAGKLAGRVPSAYGAAVHGNAEATLACAEINTNNECARVTVTVPPGKSYRAVVWSSVTAATGSIDTTIYWCPAWKPPSLSQPLCLTKSGNIENGTTGLAGTYLASGASSSTVADLDAGKYTFSTIVNPNSTIVTNAQSYTRTTVMLLDDSAPPPPHVYCFALPLADCNTGSG
ncbi:MAG: hypothetical protein QOE86_77 [Solirubrobacteraceae bacterium]|jgi:hypothetical protein|nr:hypothetical protein [Solirubrobacteraceae bacterium]